MIKFILFLCKIVFIHNFVKNLSEAFQVKNAVVAVKVKTLEEQCQEDLIKIKNKEKESKVYLQKL